MKTYGMVKTSVFFSYEGNRYLLESTLKKTIILKDWGGVGNWREKKREYWNIWQRVQDEQCSRVEWFFSTGEKKFTKLESL